MLFREVADGYIFVNLAIQRKDLPGHSRRGSAWRIALLSGRLNDMSQRATISTTIRVSKAVRDEIGALAAAEHITLEEMLRRLARAERQRRIGAELAAHQPTSAERAIIDVGLATAEQHAGR